MRIQNLNQNNYHQRPKQAFKQNVLAEITHLPNLERLSSSEKKSLLTQLIKKALKKIHDFKYAASKDFVSLVHDDELNPNFRLYFIDETTSMAKHMQKLEDEQMDIDAFQDIFLKTPDLKRITINATEELPNAYFNETPTPTSTKQQSPTGLKLKPTPKAPF